MPISVLLAAKYEWKRHVYTAAMDDTHNDSALESYAISCLRRSMKLRLYPVMSRLGLEPHATQHESWRVLTHAVVPMMRDLVDIVHAYWWPCICSYTIDRPSVHYSACEYDDYLGRCTSCHHKVRYTDERHEPSCPFAPCAQ